ncbi:MAG TPA: response regulator [Chthoniobacteraceae bacterium]|jgi:CheY-like chemotaxis protein|nr:response regulator [Chthoniobacteraceae bacterium]
MPTRILLVDDEETVTRVCGEMLEFAGYTVRVENDSRRGVQAAREFRPDVAVLDFRMPGLSGADLAWAFAATEDFRELPIVVLTGFPDAARRSSLPPGKVQILQKPMTLAVLVEAIEACLAGAGGREVGSNQ